jgi:hypothetical protein
MFNILIPTGSSIQLELGQNYGGGIIVYLLQSGDPGYDPYVQHGLIFGQFIYNSPDNNYQWDWGIAPQYNVSTGAAIGTGAANTAAIVAAYGTSDTRYAAYQCSISTYNGYTDWFLPSLEELRAIIPFANTQAFWSELGDTWTSTQYNASDAYGIYNTQTTEFHTTKNVNDIVLTIRSF